MTWYCTWSIRLSQCTRTIEMLVKWVSWNSTWELLLSFFQKSYLATLWPINSEASQGCDLKVFRRLIWKHSLNFICVYTTLVHTPATEVTELCVKYVVHGHTCDVLILRESWFLTRHFTHFHVLNIQPQYSKLFLTVWLITEPENEMRMDRLRYTAT